MCRLLNVKKYWPPLRKLRAEELKAANNVPKDTIKRP